MKKTMRYGELREITFELSVEDVFGMLKKAGQIPEGFSIDCIDGNDWPISLSIKRFIRNADDYEEVAS